MLESQQAASTHREARDCRGRGGPGGICRGSAASPWRRRQRWLASVVPAGSRVRGRRGTARRRLADGLGWPWARIVVFGVLAQWPDGVEQ